MTAALVQGILDRFLRKYIKNVTTEHATVLGGQLVFKNVELRLDVLQVYYLRITRRYCINFQHSLGGVILLQCTSEMCVCSRNSASNVGTAARPRLYSFQIALSVCMNTKRESQCKRAREIERGRNRTLDRTSERKREEKTKLKRRGVRLWV